MTSTMCSSWHAKHSAAAQHVELYRCDSPMIYQELQITRSIRPRSIEEKKFEMDQIRLDNPYVLQVINDK